MACAAGTSRRKSMASRHRDRWLRDAEIDDVTTHAAFPLKCRFALSSRGEIRRFDFKEKAADVIASAKVTSADKWRHGPLRNPFLLQFRARKNALALHPQTVHASFPPTCLHLVIDSHLYSFLAWCKWACCPVRVQILIVGTADDLSSATRHVVIADWLLRVRRMLWTDFH